MSVVRTVYMRVSFKDFYALSFQFLTCWRAPFWKSISNANSLVCYKRLCKGEKKSIVKRKQPNRCTTYNPWTIEKWIFNTLSTFKEPRTEKKLKRLIWIRYRLHVYENMASELFANAVCTFYVLFVAPLGNANSALLHFNREKPFYMRKTEKAY